MNPQERILEKSIPVPETGCWLWLGKVNQAGYPELFEFGTKQKRTAAHRLSYSAFVGPIPHGMLVCHKCDIPTCVNPGHLFIGTHKDNMADMISKGRLGAQKRRLTALEREEIRKSDLACKVLSAKFQVAPRTIRAVRNSHG